MKRLVILSDTHGLLREEVKAALAEADAILHAGDLDTPAVLEALREYPESYIVRGNNDRDWAGDLPPFLRFSIEGLRFFMVHDQSDVGSDLSDVDVVVCGHSHQYSVKERDGTLRLNPGSCGRRRFGQAITFCRMDVEKGSYNLEKIVLSK